MSEPDETERRLLAEADYFYDCDDWETTHSDLYGVTEQTDFGHNGKVVQVGRLKELPCVYAVNVPIAFDEAGEPEEWEPRAFETCEAAEAAFKAALDAGRAALEQGS